MRKILLQISIFNSILILIFSLNKIFMHFTFISDNLVQNKNEFFYVYIRGLSRYKIFKCGFFTSFSLWIFKFDFYEI